MRFRWLLLLITMLIALVSQSPAFAQSGAAGFITGYVTDQTGNPLKGVKIVATSPALMGEKVAFTNEEGSFHVIGLPPGNYKVEANAEGMNPAVDEAVPVGITSAAEVNILMDVKTAEETVTIVDRPAMVSTTKAGVKQTYDLKVVEATPFNDPINQFRDIIDMTPGTINRRVRGGGQRQTLFTQDGFEIKEQFPSLRSSAAFEVQTAGYGADAPTASGGVENLVTRSGSNQFQFEFTSVYDSSDTRLFRDKGEPSAGQRRWVINPTFSGPIIKDKLWYHLNIETHLISEPQPRDPLLVLPESEPFFNVIQKVTLKTRWQASPRNKFEVLFNGDIPYQRNNRRDPGISDEAQQDRLAQRYFLGVTWESLLSDSVLFRSQAGATGYFQDIYPANCREDRMPSTCYTLRNIKQRLPTALEFGNGPKHDTQRLKTLQFINTLEWFASTKNFGEHNFRLKDIINLESDKNTTSQTGDGFYEYNGTVATNFTTFYSNDPRLEQAKYGNFNTTVYSMKHVLTASDNWKITPYLSATPALSWIQARATNNLDRSPLSTNTWAPAVSLVWDVTRDGRNVLRTSGSVYVDVDLSNVGRHAVGSQVTLRCGWNPTTQQFDRDCVYSGGASRSTVGLPCGPNGIDANGNSCRKELNTPRTWEATLGGSHVITDGLAAGLDAVYRKFTNQYEDIETNRIWNQSGTAVIGYRSGVNETVMDLETPKGANRQYFGVTLSLAKNQGPLQLNASYTLGWLTGSVLDGFQNYYGNVPPQDRFLTGPLADDHRHEIKMTGMYQWNPWLVTGFRYIYTSGTPYNRLYFNDVTGRYESYRASSGVDPGANLNDPNDDRTLRTPDIQSINIQVRALLKPLIGQNLSVFAEVLNVLGLRTPQTLGTGDGRDFGLVLTRMDPFRLRFGVDFRWPGEG
ncbi:MAG: carboxypeptidase-like regulatory domain-containing protein [Polyangiaceae bacterium]